MQEREMNKCLHKRSGGERHGREYKSCDISRSAALQLKIIIPSHPSSVLEAQAADGVALDHGQIDLVAEEIPDVVDAIQNHGRPFQ